MRAALFAVLLVACGGRSLTSRGVLSNQVTIAPGESADLLHWSGDEAEQLTVSLAPVEQVFPPGNFDVRPYAIVDMTAKGFMIEVEVDIGNGCRLALNSSDIAVRVGLESSAPQFTDVESMTLSGLMSFLPGESTILTRTKYIEFPTEHGTLATVKVPPFAKSFKVIREKPEASSLLVTVASAYETPIYDAQVAKGELMNDSLALPDDAVSVAVYTPDNIHHVRVVFELSL